MTIYIEKNNITCCRKAEKDIKRKKEAVLLDNVFVPSALVFVPSGQILSNINAISRCIGMKTMIKMTSDRGKPTKKKEKRNNIRWDSIYANKISFRFIDKLLSIFSTHLFNEIDTFQSHGISRCTEII